jgi:hypothetical protein
MLKVHNILDPAYFCIDCHLTREKSHPTLFHMLVIYIKNMLDYEVKRLFFLQLIRCHLIVGRWKFTKEERTAIHIFGRNIKGLQAAVRCLSRNYYYFRMREG